jgi:antirestriction protein
MKATNLNQAQIYVGTYAKYNNGSIAGGWLDLSDYSNKDEFLQACAELHPDEADPEYMYQDWENIPDSLISESWVSEKLFSLISRIEDINNMEAFTTFVEWRGYNLDTEDIDGIISDFEDSFCGEYSSEEEYAYDVVEEYYDLPDFAKTYFDYEAFARDLFISDNYFDNDFVFRNR